MTRRGNGGPAWRRYLRFRGPDVEADVAEELEFHLAMRARAYEAQGMSPDEARRAALERFGDVRRIEGELRTHDRRRERGQHRREWMSDLMQDLRYGLRALGRAPGFTLIAMLTLALGIGATTAIFSVVNAVILRPLPYADADRIVQIWMDNRLMGLKEDLNSWPNLTDLDAQNAVLSEMAIYAGVGFNLTGGCIEGDCEPERIAGAVSTADLFGVLGVSPRIGRTFTAREQGEGNDGVVVISHGLWTRYFAGDPSALGRTIRLNGRERTVLGVMPRGFAFPTAETQVWVPEAFSEQLKQGRTALAFSAIGRLKPGVSVERAQADMSALAARLEQEYPVNRGFGVFLRALPEQLVGGSLRTALWVMLGAVAAVLLIACANVANLMLSRAAVREREVGVRLALGASRQRLVRQLLTESVLLAALGAAVGLALAWAGLRLLIALAPSDIPRLDEVRLDGVVLGVALLLAIVTGIAFGLVPALQASRPNLTEALREGSRGGTAGRGGQRIRRALVAAQVALVVVLLTAAGLLVRSFVELQRVQLGFRPDGLLTMRLSLPGTTYQGPPQRRAFHEALLERVRQLPGVEGAASISDIFLSTTPSSTIFTLEGREMTQEEQGIELPLDAVTPEYFRVMGVPILRGRDFSAQDGPDAMRVVIINEAMARRFWPGEDAVGRRFRYGQGAADSTQAPWLTIVGVVGDMRRTGYDAPVRYETFLPLSQYTPSAMTLVVRAGNDALALAKTVRGEIRALDSELPVYEVKSVNQTLGEMVAQRRFSMVLLGTFAALALTLGLVGVYGVTSYLVAQRTREVGLRLALGAQPGELVAMVVRQGMLVAAAGIALGLAGALVVGRLMSGLLYGITSTDAVTLLTIPALIALATLLANWVPARRAARVDPLVALRNE